MDRDSLVIRKSNAHYKDNRTMQAIYGTQSQELQRASDMVSRAYKNAFIFTADERGISDWEYILDIQPAGDLEARRSRVIAALLTLPPFTKQVLWNLLRSLLGDIPFDLSIDHENYTIHIAVYTADTRILHEIQDLIVNLIPANMVISSMAAIGIKASGTISVRTNAISSAIIHIKG